MWREAKREFRQSVTTVVWAVPATVTGIAAFVGTWMTIADYGMLGIALGWIPALAVGALAALIWPVALLGVVRLFH